MNTTIDNKQMDVALADVYATAVACYDTLKLDEAQGFFEAIVAREPSHLGALTGLGMTFWRKQQYEKARHFLEQVVQLSPRDEHALRGLGMTLLSIGDYKRAEVVADSIEWSKIETPQTMLTIALIKERVGKVVEAEQMLLKAIQLHPRYSEAYNNLGVLRFAAGDTNGARSLYLHAIVLQPTNADAYKNLSLVLQEEGRLKEAESLLDIGLRHCPVHAGLWNEKGSVCKKLMTSTAAIHAYRQAIACEPHALDPISNLSTLLYHDGDSEGARALCDKIIERHPKRFGIRLRKVTALPAIMESHAAVQDIRYRLAQELREVAEAPGIIGDPLRDVNITNFYLAYHGYNERQFQQELANLYISKAPMLSFVAPHIGRTRSGGRIRVGVCSRHWEQHTIGLLFTKLFTLLSPESFDLTVFHTSSNDSNIQRGFARDSTRVCRLPLDVAAAQKLVADKRLDVLIYPDIGMEPFTYFLAFSRLAPLQCTLWGHPLTTGIPTIDCFISARDLEVDGAQAHYSERLVCLPSLNTYYERPTLDRKYTREHFGLPLQQTLYVCPQTLFKFHPDFDPMIEEILSADKDSIVVLIEGNSEGHTARLQSRFAKTLRHQEGQIRFLPRLSHEAFLGLLSISDVLLDTPHFGGGSTSMQALSFGTPIVTLPSEFLRGRITLACYKQVGDTSLVAKDSGNYVRLATGLGSDEDQRRSIRQRLCERSNGLFNNEHAVRELEKFLEREVY